MTARGSLRRRFVVTAIASTAIAIVLFVVGSFAVIAIDDGDADIAAGDSFRSEATEMIFGAMAVAAPLAIAAGVITAIALSRRTARPVEDAIAAARETTAHDLRRSLPVPAADGELRDLVVALNELFARLDDGFGALARFAADASHELRTPLAVIATDLEVALRHPRSADEWETTARTALDELRRLSALVEGLLSLARAGADAPAARAPVRVIDRVDAVVAQLADQAERAGISLVAPTDEVTASVPGNAVMLETGIRNLVVNALAAVSRGGEVRIGIETRDAELAIVVDDNGPGLGPDPEALFTPFSRGADRGERSERAAGVGLGLAIARRIATSHGGTLSAGASPLGGARFTLALPRA